MRARISALVLTVLAAGAPGVAAAQEAAAVGAPSARPGLPRGRLELGYGVSIRQDSQTVDQVDVTADGVAPSHLRAEGAVFFGDLPVGVAAQFGWERFTLQGTNLRGEQVSLNAIALNAGGGLALRFDLRGWALEADVGYAWHRLPVVDSTSPGLRSGAVQTHGPMLAVRFGLPTGSWFLPEIHASTIPYAMAATPLGSSAGWRLDAGVGLGFGALPLGGVEWTAVLGYDYGLEQVDGDGGKYSQAAHRVGLALRVGFPGPSRPAGSGTAVSPQDEPGTIRGVLYDPDGKPVPVHAITVQVPGRPEATVQTAEDGRFVVKDVAPGTATLKAAAEKLKPAQVQAEVAPGAEVEVVLRLTRPTGPGSIRGVVYDKPADPAARQPVAGAQVEAAGLAPVTTDAQGAFAFPQIGPGLVPLKVSAKGFVAAEEVVSVAAQAEARVELSLVAEKARPLATLRGVVRAVGGKPLKARLTVPEAKVSATASASGEFLVKVPGGKYRVRVEARGYRPQVKTVEVADGDQAIFNIDMHPAR